MPTPIFRDLKVRLTQDEWEAAANEMASTQERRDALEDERKRQAADAKARLTELDAKVAELGAKVRTRTEERAVKCFEVQVAARSSVELYREDTGELVESRAMTAAERERALQTRLPGVPEEPPGLSYAGKSFGEIAADVMARATADIMGAAPGVVAEVRSARRAAKAATSAPRPAPGVSPENADADADTLGIGGPPSPGGAAAE